MYLQSGRQCALLPETYTAEEMERPSIPPSSVLPKHWDLGMASTRHTLTASYAAHNTTCMLLVDWQARDLLQQVIQADEAAGSARVGQREAEARLAHALQHIAACQDELVMHQQAQAAMTANLQART